MNSSPQEDKDFFYVTYQGSGLGGAMVIPQFKIEGGGKNPDGMNLAEATRHLYMTFGATVVITSWRQITRRRRDEFEALVASFQKSDPKNANNITHLKLVPKE